MLLRDFRIYQVDEYLKWYKDFFCYYFCRLKFRLVLGIFDKLLIITKNDFFLLILLISCQVINIKGWLNLGYVLYVIMEEGIVKGF